MRFFAASLLAAFSLASAHASERLYLQYEAHAWGLLPLGQAAMDVSVRPDAYRVGATVQSGGFLRLFDQTDIKASASGAVGPSGPLWARYDLDHNYAKKRRVTAMWVDGGAVATDVKPVWTRLGVPPATEDQKRASRDPLSSIVAMGVAMARTHACVGDFYTFDGRHLYDLRLSGKPAPDHVRTDGYDGPVLKCTINYLPIAGYDPKDAADSRKKTPHAEMWFALTDNPDFAPPVRMVLPLGLGNASLVLTQWRRAQVTAGDDATATNLPISAPPATGPNPPATQ